LWAQALVASSSLIPLPQHDLLIHKHLFPSLIFGRAGEYSQAIHILAPFFPTPIFSNTTSPLTTLHLKLNGYFLLLFKDYKLN